MDRQNQSVYKLIAIDCDGTLLNGKKELTEGTVEAIKRVKQDGVKVVLASARPFYRLKKFLKALDLLSDDQYTIAFNGGLIIQNGTEKTVYSRSFQKEQLAELLSVAKTYNPDVFMYGATEIYSSHDNEGYKKCNPDVNFNVVDVDALDLSALEIYKFAYVNSPENIVKLREIFPADVKERYETSSSVPQFIEVVTKNVTKSSALQTIGEILGIKPSEMVVFGDEDNDLPMMKFAGCAVAMGNGSAAVKECAHFVTKSNDEDGVAYALRKIFYGE